MHRVPISDEVVAILETVKGLSKKWVFPGRKGKPLSDNALLILLERLELGAKTTTHGFRSAFRMWAAEQTNYPREICEQALAHSTQDEVEAAYMRGDHFNKRTALMRDWAVFLGQQDAVQSPLAAE
jgi:integrase